MSSPLLKTAFRKFEEQLTCSICLDTYSNPKLLQCHHVHCQKCLVKLVIQDQQGQSTLTCPNCREVTLVPDSGVAGLQAAFQLNTFIDIIEDHKKSKTATSKGPPRCSEHADREVELYCYTCEETICYKCIAKDWKHHSHDYAELSEAIEKVIISSLEPMHRQLTTIKEALVQLNMRRNEVSDLQEAIETEIHSTFASIQETLNLRKSELISQLNQLAQAKLKSLDAQRDLIETTQAQLSSCLSFMRENLQTGNQGEALLLKSTTLRIVKEWTTTFQPDMLEPNSEADMVFSALADLSAQCQNYGKVYAVGSPDPSKCCVTKLQTAFVGETSTAIIDTLDFNGQPCNASIKCKLVSDLTGAKMDVKVESSRKGRFETSYRPPIKGKHQLHITVEGQHIRGSPLPVIVKSPVENLGPTPILSIGGVKGPEGIAVNKKGEVVVTEMGGHCVSVLSLSGERLRSFGKHGSGQGEFIKPFGVALDSEGNILVADQGNHRIQKFTAQGEFIKAVGGEGNGPLQFDSLRGVAFNASNNRIYVSEDGNNRIHILNFDLNNCGTFGKKGNSNGNFASPRYIACDSIGNVYVTDSDNHRIQVFTAEGKFLRTIGKCGEGRGELKQPWGITVDSSGTVYVSEWGNDRISTFTSDGQFVTSFGTKGKDPGQFDDPCGLNIDSNGILYVCDYFSDRIQLF